MPIKIDAWINVFRVPEVAIHKKGHPHSSSGQLGPDFTIDVGRSRVGFGIRFEKSAIADDWRKQVPNATNYHRIKFRGGEGSSIDAENGCRYATVGIRGS